MKKNILMVLTVIVLSFAAITTSHAVVFDFKGTGWGAGEPYPDIAGMMITKGMIIDVEIYPFASTDPNGTAYPLWSAVTGNSPDVGIYPGSTGLGVVAYSGDNVNMDGSNQRESLLFVFNRAVNMSSINFTHVGNTDDFNLTVDGVNSLIDIAPNPTNDPNLRDIWYNVSYTGTQFRIWADGSDDDFRIAGINVNVVPEPMSFILFMSGGILLLGKKIYDRSRDA